MKVQKKTKDAPVRQFRVRSKSKPDEYHLIQVFDDEEIVCDCVAGFFKAKCWHRKLIRKYLDSISSSKKMFNSMKKKGFFKEYKSYEEWCVKNQSN